MKTPKFKTGDIVFYTNGNGVKWGKRKILSSEKISYGKNGIGYYIEPTDTPWYPVPEENFKLIT